MHACSAFMFNCLAVPFVGGGGIMLADTLAKKYINMVIQEQLKHMGNLYVCIEV